MDVLKLQASQLPCLPLQAGDEFVRPHATFRLGSFHVSKSPLGRFGGQLFNARLELTVGSQVQDRLRFVWQNDLQHQTNLAFKGGPFRSRWHSQKLRHQRMLFSWAESVYTVASNESPKTSEPISNVRNRQLESRLRETRQSGLEGGARFNPSFLPQSSFGQPAPRLLPELLENGFAFGQGKRNPVPNDIPCELILL